MSNVPKLRFKGFVGEYNSYQLNELGEYGKSYAFSRAYEGEGDVHHIHYGDIHIKLPTIISDSSVLPSITEKRDFQYAQVGDIVIADASEDYKDLGKAICINDDSHKVVSGLHTHRFSPNRKFVISDYLVRYMQTDRYRRFIYKMGTGVSVLGISKTNLSKFRLKLPTLDEQRIVANFFNELESRIERQKEKIELLKERKKGYMQKIFNRELRFKDENGKEYSEWREYKLKNILKEFIEKTTENGQFPIVSSTSTGLYLQSEYFKKQVASKNTSGYKILKRNQIVLSPQNLWMGNINFNNNFEVGIVSPSYKVFDIESDDFSEKFIAHLLRTPRMMYNYKISSEQGASIVRRNLDMNSFYGINIKIPEKREQEKIAEFLMLMEQKIEKERNYLNEMVEQKKGFMQQMFV